MAPEQRDQSHLAAMFFVLDTKTRSLHKGSSANHNIRNLGDAPSMWRQAKRQTALMFESCPINLIENSGPALIVGIQ
jgi:hypothetical protein